MGLRRNGRKPSPRRAQRAATREPAAYIRPLRSGPDLLEGQSPARKQRRRAQLLTCAQIPVCSLPGSELHSICAHSRPSASRAAQSVRAISAKLRKVQRAPGEERVAARYIRTEPRGWGPSRGGGGAARRRASVRPGAGKCAAGGFSPSGGASSKLRPPRVLREAPSDHLLRFESRSGSPRAAADLPPPPPPPQVR